MFSKIKQTPVKHMVNFSVGAVVLLATAVPFILAQRAQALFNFPGYNGKIAYVSNETGDDEIYTINPDGTGKTNITNNPDSDTMPRWSPDGTRLMFISARSGSDDLYSANPDGSDLQQLTALGSITSPQYSYDGTKILFASNGDIYVMNADGSDLQQLTNDNLSYITIWSPDGTQIAYSVQDTDDGSVDLYMMNADGSNQHVILETTDLAYYQSWSPDGTKIAYANYPNGVYEGEIYTINPDGTDNAQLSNTGDQVNIYAGESSWSQDSTRLLFTRIDIDDNIFEIMMINRDGTNQHGVFNDALTASWSPDNTQLVSSNFGGDTGSGLSVSDTEGGNRNFIEAGEIYEFSWQPLTLAPTSNQPNPTIAYTGLPVTYNVVANTTDAYGAVDPTTVSITEQPTQGTVSIDPATGVITYTPNATVTAATDHFTYRVCSLADNRLCTTNTITIIGISVAGGGQLAPTGTNAYTLLVAAGATIVAAVAIWRASRRSRIMSTWR